MEHLDESPTSPGTDLVHQATALEIPVAAFEGEYVRKMFAKIPGVSITMENGYPRGTHLKLECEMRVKSVTVDDVKDGPTTVPARIHTLVFEDVKLLGAYAREELDPGVEGNVAGGF